MAEVDESKLEEAYQYWHDCGFDEGYDEGYDIGYCDGWDAEQQSLGEGRETFTLSEIEQLFDDLGKSDGGTTTAVVDGIEYSTDWGYGMEAVEHFINMLKRRHGLLH